MSVEIKNFEDLIKPSLSPGQQFMSYECDSLLPPGENYGSIMLKVDVKTMKENGEEDIIHCVAKTTPPPGFIWEAFNIKATFKKEITLYTTIVPALNNFAKEKETDYLLNFFPKCLGGRISLDPNSDVVDENAVLLLENLFEEGYVMADRYNGLDEQTTRHVLRDLAILHATPIAYRSAKPDEFQENIRQHLKRDLNLNLDGSTMGSFLKLIQDALSRNPECLPHIGKIEEALQSLKNFIENPAQGKEIFATVVHNDYWINNTMLKYENGKIINNKMVDFQMLGYNSLAHDIISFLYGNLELSLLKDKLDELIRFYYDEFINALVKLQHDVSEYSYESMMEEFAIMAKDFQFTRTILILNPIMIIKGNVPDVTEVDGKVNIEMGQMTLHENYYPKVQFALLDFVKRGWI